MQLVDRYRSVVLEVLITSVFIFFPFLLSRKYPRKLQNFRNSQNWRPAICYMLHIAPRCGIVAIATTDNLVDRVSLWWLFRFDDFWIKITIIVIFIHSIQITGDTKFFCSSLLSYFISSYPSRKILNKILSLLKHINVMKFILSTISSDIIYNSLTKFLYYHKNSTEVTRYFQIIK